MRPARPRCSYNGGGWNILECPEMRCTILPSGGQHSGRPQAADSSVAELGERGPRGPNILLRLTKTPARLDATGKGGQEGFPEALVHEAVDDGVDASRGIRQQVNEGYGGAREHIKGGALIKRFPGVGDVDGHPADEEHGHDDDEHADDPLLGHELGFGVVDAGSVHHGAAARGQGGHLQGVTSLADLDVAAVTLVTVGGRC